MKQINTRADLEAMRGTADFDDAMRSIAGASTILVDVAVRPENYSDPSYDGPEIAAEWEHRNDDATLIRLGMTREDLSAELAAISAESQ